MTTLTEMTDSDLARRARDYDAAQNEGGDGYNPYQAEADRREEQITDAQPRTIESLEREIELLRGTAHANWGQLSEATAAKIAALEQQLAPLVAAEEAEKAREEEAHWAEWTAEETSRRRGAFNARVAAGEFSSKLALLTAERDQGWTLKDLKRAIKHHRL